MKRILWLSGLVAMFLGFVSCDLPTSYGKGDEACGGLVEGTYSITWDIVDGNTGSVLSSWIYENVEIHQGKDAESATVRISSVDGKPRT